MRQNVLMIFFFCVNLYLFGFQNTSKDVDTLAGKTFNELNTSLVQSMRDTLKMTIYAKAILRKGKQEKDSVQMLNGYYFLSVLNTEEELVFKYSDSIIDIGRKIGSDRFVGMTFLNKGKHLFTARKFKKALDNFINAQTYLRKFPDLTYFNDHNIGLLKSRVGDYHEANEIFKKNWKIVKGTETPQNYHSYLISLFSLADSYHRVKVYDSATHYNRLGIKKTLQYKDTSRYYQFVLNEGINQYHLENYSASYDSVFKVIEEYKNDLNIPDLIFAYQYCGKNLMVRNEEDMAIICFRKVDSLFNLKYDIHPEARDTYEYLIDFYKSKGDLSNQLKYVTQLLKVDSVLNTNNQYLSKKIAKLYDTPKLLDEKEHIIDSLENKNNLTSNKLYAVLVLLVVMTIGLFYFYYRQRVFKKRFLSLMSPDNKITEEVTRPVFKQSKIPQEVITHILGELDLFEKGEDFLDSTITLNDLSKQFNTNSKYLSKVINTYKNKNFSVYVNDLRVEYVVEKVKKDSKFRNYTIKAISGEAGFNTTQAFSKAFHKSTGIYPSYFIRNIEKLQDHNS